MKKYPLFVLILCICLAFSACSGDSSAAPEAASISLPRNWEPVLEVEEAGPDGATAVLREGSTPDNCVVLCGNDYVLEQLTDGSWQSLPTLEEPHWVTDAFAVTAVPREEIRWQWLYGSLPSGYYRIGKSVSLQQNTEIIASATVYAEFPLKVTDPNEPGNVYDASEIAANAPSPVYAPLTSLDSGYTPEQALQDQVVILTDGWHCENPEVWYAFAARAASGQSANVRCMVTDSATGKHTVYDICYDGVLYSYVRVESGEEQTLTFKQLLSFREALSGDPNVLDRYILTSDSAVAWEDILWGTVSDSEDDRIPHKTVFQQLASDPERLSLPECSHASLRYRGKIRHTADSAAAQKLTALLRGVCALPEKPDMEYTGLELVLHGADGSSMTLWLDAQGRYILYDGVFYPCPGNEIRKALGISAWPEG